MPIIVELPKVREITEANYAPVLKTGDKFKATTKHSQYTYEFIGYAPQENSCMCIILKNLDTGEILGVEHLWFCKAYCGRQIEILKEEQ